MEIKVMTFNMHHGKGRDGKVNLNRIAEVIEASEADLIGLNEVDRCYSKRSGFTDQLSWLADRLHMNASFAASLTLSAKGSLHTGHYGNALLSRYPVISQQKHVLGKARSGLREARVLLEAFVQINGQPIKLYVTHLSLNPIAHRQQVDFVVRTVTDEKQPVILMGDMNMRSGSKAWKKITTALHDACRLHSEFPCYTFPSIRPAIQLDYIFISRHFQITRAEVFRKHAMASDHLPLTAGLLIDL